MFRSAEIDLNCSLAHQLDIAVLMQSENRSFFPNLAYPSFQNGAKKGGFYIAGTNTAQGRFSSCPLFPGGGAVDFAGGANGASDICFEMEKDPIYRWSLSEGLSAVAWICCQADSVSGAAYIQNILCDETSVNPWFTMVFRIGSQGLDALKRRVALAIMNPGGPDFYDNQSEEDIPIGRWCSVGFSFNNSAVRFFIDGRYAGQTTRNIANAQLENTVNWTIGRGNINTGTVIRPFNGLIGPVFRWRRALADDEIRDFQINPAKILINRTQARSFVGNVSAARLIARQGIVGATSLVRAAA